MASDNSLRAAVGPYWLQRHVEEALAEDLGERGDITCQATVPSGKTGHAELIAKQTGVLAGIDWAVECGQRVTPAVDWVFSAVDGDAVEKGQVIATIDGPLDGILMSERTAINGLARLCGIATMAAEASRLIEGTRAVVLETRKTTPGWRLAEKYAVRMGGAQNHRMGLYDEILIKENHIESAGGVMEALQAAKQWRAAQQDDPGRNTPVEIEVEDLQQLEWALSEHPDRILLDNFGPELLQQAVERTAGRCLLEASGGITLENLREVALTGVDRISLGALTHSIKPLDLSLLVKT